MIELATASWRNFMSYGDYPTSVNLAELGQCLITGEVLKEQESQKIFDFSRDVNASNGAGKSHIANAVLWTIFGRTMHAAAPGTNVINHFSKGDCWGEVKFKNGDRITRTITRDGRTELVWVREGNEAKLTSDTIATTKLQQQKLNREFDLDWELMCGSSFFTQYNRPWMEMSDQVRKQAMERALHVDRFTLYGQVAGEKATKIDQERAKKRALLGGLEADVRRVTDDLEGHRASIEVYEQERQERHAEALVRVEDAIAKRDAVTLPDLDKVRAQWDVVTKVKAKVTELKSEAEKHRSVSDKHRLDRDSHRRQAEDVRTKIKRWEQKEGKACIQCEQEVPHEHVAGKVEGLVPEAENWDAKAEQSESKRKQFSDLAIGKDQEATALKERLSQKLPKLTLQDAEYIHREWKGYNRDAIRYQAEADQILAEKNPHGTAIARAEQRLQSLQAEMTKAVQEVEYYTGKWNHFNYIQKAYSDRRKIKSAAISRHIPYVNSRLSYYLDVFNLDLKMQFTNSLGIESDLWGYTYYCGGERKRTDLAIMFAMFDLHEEMYGRQSNVMVLDEVDARMDAEGVESLVQIIKNDLSAKVESVLVISHKTYLQDVFPRQIHVRRDGRFSQLAEVR